MYENNDTDKIKGIPVVEEGQARAITVDAVKAKQAAPK